MMQNSKLVKEVATISNSLEKKFYVRIRAINIKYRSKILTFKNARSYKLLKERYKLIKTVMDQPLQRLG